MENRIITAIGAGGKTSSLINIALQNTHKRVLITTTTHIYPIEAPISRQLLINPTREQLCFSLSGNGIVCAGNSSKDGKITSLEKNLLDEALSTAELILIEADGARCLPLKLHNETEPVMPERYDVCLVLAGLSAFGREVCDTVHRYELNPEWKENPHRKVGIDEIVYCIEDAVSSVNLPKEKALVILNQADNEEMKRIGEEIRSRLSYKAEICKDGYFTSL